MALFSGARDFDINGGSFQAHAHEHHHQEHVGTIGNDGFLLLRHACAFSASHDSAERFPPPKCHPETRRAVVQAIHEWINNRRAVATSPDILWLYGPAGAGKSAIAQTIAEECQAAATLVASFFFSRTSRDRNDEKSLVTTVAYQLAISMPEVKPFIVKAVKRNPAILNKSVEVQVAELIVKPIKKAKKYHWLTLGLFMRLGFKRWPKVVIIDGLDECNNRNMQCRIVRIISEILSSEKLPLRFLIASRPEPDIRDTFDDPAVSRISRRIVLDDTYRAREDIRLHLRNGFLDVQKRHHYLWPAGTDQQPWPSADVIDKLVFKSSGQFIYASTILKFVDDRSHNPIQRLDMILGMINPGVERPFAQLDLLYTQILRSIANPDHTMRVLGTLLVIDSSSRTVSSIEELLFLEPGELYVLLADLHSLLFIPDSRDMLPTSREIAFYHASFPDFLLDRSRSQEFFVDEKAMHRGLMNDCLIVLEHALTDNGPSRGKMPRGVVEYANSHWHIHFMTSVIGPGAEDLFQGFDVVKWMEFPTDNLTSNFARVDILQEILDWLKAKHSHRTNDITFISDCLDIFFDHNLTKRLADLKDNNLDSFVSLDLLAFRSFQLFMSDSRRIGSFFRAWDVDKWIEDSSILGLDKSKPRETYIKRLDILPKIVHWLSQECHLEFRDRNHIQLKFSNALNSSFKKIIEASHLDSIELGMIMNEYADHAIIRGLIPDHGKCSRLGQNGIVRGILRLSTFQQYLAESQHSTKYCITPEVHAIIAYNFLQVMAFCISTPPIEFEFFGRNNMSVDYAERNYSFHLSKASPMEDLVELAETLCSDSKYKDIGYGKETQIVIIHWLMSHGFGKKK